jgi:hypothetical protein
MTTVGRAQLAAVRVERRLRPQPLERAPGRRGVAVREQPRRRRVEIGPVRTAGLVAHGPAEARPQEAAERPVERQDRRDVDVVRRLDE